MIGVFARAVAVLAVCAFDATMTVMMCGHLTLAQASTRAQPEFSPARRPVPSCPGGQLQE